MLQWEETHPVLNLPYQLDWSENQTTASTLFDGANGTLRSGTDDIIRCREMVPSRITYNLLPISGVSSTLVLARADAAPMASKSLMAEVAAATSNQLSKE
jgi:hypothetical protein